MLKTPIPKSDMDFPLPSGNLKLLPVIIQNNKNKLLLISFHKISWTEPFPHGLCANSTQCQNCLMWKTQNTWWPEVLRVVEITKVFLYPLNASELVGEYP